MRPNELAYLLEAKLQSSPSISRLGAFTSFLESAQKECAFFARDLESAKEAAAKGAFAIIYDLDFEVFDPEIAFLKVESLREAAFRLARFLGLKKSVFLLENPLQAQIARRLRLSVLENDIFKDLELLQKDESLLFSHDECYIKRFASPIRPPKTRYHVHKNSSRFFCDAVIYCEQKEQKNSLFLNENCGILLRQLALPSELLPLFAPLFALYKSLPNDFCYPELLYLDSKKQSTNAANAQDIVIVEEDAKSLALLKQTLKPGLEFLPSRDEFEPKTEEPSLFG